MLRLSGISAFTGCLILAFILAVSTEKLVKAEEYSPPELTEEMWVLLTDAVLAADLFQTLLPFEDTEALIAYGEAAQLLALDETGPGVASHLIATGSFPAIGHRYFHSARSIVITQALRVRYFCLVCSFFL